MWVNTWHAGDLCGTDIAGGDVDPRPRAARQHSTAAKVELKLNGISQTEARTILREYNVSDDGADALATIAADVNTAAWAASWKSWTSV